MTHIVKTTLQMRHKISVALRNPQKTGNLKRRK
ncbi:hypothetical protein SBA4_3960008 [Candidatus Sulfopaludibacter sp. SbA4]|nr:hypothetical protein SBA4_3960008 [Candidatus Sulfopaludibacter sp. SbA4]